MSDWSQVLSRLRRERTPVMLVSVDSIVGSTPREAGAKMLVTAEQQYGTIGGGNLEYQACRIARDQLELGEAGGLQRFPLGAGLGQCCGGLVNLMFERLEPDSDWSRAELDENKRAEMYFECQKICRDEGGNIVHLFGDWVLGASEKCRYENVAGDWSPDGAKAAERWWFA